MRSAFTLLEFLVVIAIIAVLLAAVSISLRGFRQAAMQTRSMSALRQIGVAYSGYVADHRQRLLPGYIEADLFEPGERFEDLSVHAPDGTLLGAEASQSWVWRLAPWVGGGWEIFYTDLKDPGLLSGLEAEYAAGIYGPPGASVIDGGISERPSFGLNELFIGRYHTKVADKVFDQSVPDTPSFRAEAFSQILTPSTVILFAPSARARLEGEQTVLEQPGGFHLVAPPYTCGGYDGAGRYVWSVRVWSAGGQGQAELVPPAGTGARKPGVPVDRWGRERIPLVHVDGSTSVEQIAALSRDMRRWAPREVTRSRTRE